MLAMGRPRRTRRAIPMWLSVLLAVFPALGGSVPLLMLLTGHPQIGDLSRRNSELVAGIGSVLVFTVLALAILSVVSRRAMR